MRKFKHKTAGYIAEKLTTCEKYKLKISTSDIIPAWVIENSNDWEEIVEKDYEILMYRSKNNSCIYFDNPKYFSSLNSDWEIYSVRRKSDGVEFKIGDRVCWEWAFAKNKYFTIKSFNIIEDKLRFNTVEESGQNFIFELLSKEYNLQHYKEPILTTEDGYECTLDDRVFGVLSKANWQTNYCSEKGVLVFNLFNPQGKRWNLSSEWLWFKTKENAEKYIYENKPEFSRKQILDALKYAKYAEFSQGIWVLALKIKEKLGL